MRLPNWLDTLVGDTRAALLRLLRRPPQTITGLSRELGLTDNAVRLHLAALGRDGLVQQVGTERDTGGKPARTYAITREGEELFPKAYATALAGLVEVIAARHGRDHAIELLQAVGHRLAPGVPEEQDDAHRVEAAAAALRALGGDVDVEPTPHGWRLQGHGCPLSAVTAERDEVCGLATALVERMTGLPVRESCDRAERPSCGFVIGPRASVPPS